MQNLIINNRKKFGSNDLEINANHNKIKIVIENLKIKEEQIKKNTELKEKNFIRDYDDKLDIDKFKEILKEKIEYYKNITKYIKTEIQPLYDIFIKNIKVIITTIDELKDNIILDDKHNGGEILFRNNNSEKLKFLKYLEDFLKELNKFIDQHNIKYNSINDKYNIYNEIYSKISKLGDKSIGSTSSYSGRSSSDKIGEIIDNYNSIISNNSINSNISFDDYDIKEYRDIYKKLSQEYSKILANVNNKINN